MKQHFPISAPVVPLLDSVPIVVLPLLSAVLDSELAPTDDDDPSLLDDDDAPLESVPFDEEPPASSLEDPVPQPTTLAHTSALHHRFMSNLQR